MQVAKIRTYETREKREGTRMYVYVATIAKRTDRQTDRQTLAP